MSMGDSLQREHIQSGPGKLLKGSPEGIALYTFVSSACGATNLYTGSAVFEPGAILPFHTHKVSEALVILDGHATVLVENRSYSLGPLDCIHFPAHVAHSVRNDDLSARLVGHSTFAEAQPSRTFVTDEYNRDDRTTETLRRFDSCEKYLLSDGALFCDLFAKRFGSVGICGGYAQFRPGSSLPCHVHQYDESITIVSGEALCQVQGKEYKLSGLDTAFVPEGRPHRFINDSERPMAMIWVYAGDEPDRTLVENGYCSGSMIWPQR